MYCGLNTAVPRRPEPIGYSRNICSCALAITIRERALPSASSLSEATSPMVNMRSMNTLSTITPTPTAPTSASDQNNRRYLAAMQTASTSSPATAPRKEPRLLASTKPLRISGSDNRAAIRRQPFCVSSSAVPITSAVARYMPRLLESSMFGPPTPSSRPPLRPSMWA